MIKRKPTPNYKLMYESAVNGLQIAYSEYKKARIEATVLNSLVPISKAEICNILPDVSPTTVEAVLSVMVKNGQVKKIGQSRMTRYIKI